MKKLALSSLILLSACSSMPDWLGSAEETPLPGERISVIDSSINLKPDASLAAETITPVGSAINFDNEKSFSIGEPAAEGYVLTNPPIIADGKIFTIDGIGNVAAYKLGSYDKLWKNKTYTGDEDEKELPGGGIAYANGIVYATRGDGTIIAISADTGNAIWKKNLGASIRKSPAIGDDKIYAATTDNQLFALNLVDGATVWRHSGSLESTINYGSPAPAFKDGIVVIAYSSGEIFGLNSARGSELWAETISTGTERRKTAATFVDVSASPVLVDGIAYIGSQNGSVIAYNTTTGYRIWEQKIGSIHSTPIIADKFIFAIGDNDKIVALNRFDGKVKWVSNLPAKEDKKQNIIWNGPVLAGSTLITVSSTGKIAVYDANNGQTTGLKDAPESVFASPLVNDGKLYLLNRDAELAVY